MKWHRAHAWEDARMFEWKIDLYTIISLCTAFTKKPFKWFITFKPKGKLTQRVISMMMSHHLQTLYMHVQCTLDMFALKSFCFFTWLVTNALSSLFLELFNLSHRRSLRRRACVCMNGSPADWLTLHDGGVCLHASVLVKSNLENKAPRMNRREGWGRGQDR